MCTRPESEREELIVLSAQCDTTHRRRATVWPFLFAFFLLPAFVMKALVKDSR